MALSKNIANTRLVRKMCTISASLFFSWKKIKENRFENNKLMPNKILSINEFFLYSL